MKKLFFFLFSIPLIVPAQTTKTDNIFTSGNCKVSCIATFDNDSLVSAFVTFDAKDDRLPKLQNYFTIYYDTPQRLIAFLSELERFSVDNSQTLTELNRHKVEIDKTTGSRTVKVYDERGMIFHRFTPSLITNIKTTLLGWAVKNNINTE